MKRLSVWLAVLALALASLLLGVSAQPVRADELPPLVIVFDVSGSMNDKDSRGTVKLSTAKQSISSLVRAQPPRTPMGVWTYPGGVSVDGCSAGAWINQLSPANHPDPTEVDAEVRALSAEGDTPTGPALKAITQSLQQMNYDAATIVLVSDGESNCGPPPCEVAKSVVAAGFDLTVAAVAFDIESGKSDELSCIANATGGSYTEAANSDELIEELQKYRAQDLELTVAGPERVLSGTHASFTATIKNPSTVDIVGASLLISFDDRSLVSYLPSPHLRLPAIPAGQSVSRTWVVGTSSLLEGETDWRVLAGSRQAGSVIKSGVLEVSQSHLNRTDGGDILSARGGTVVVLGDSYSSGEGTEQYHEKHTACHRSDYAYGNFLGSSVEIIACSGALARHMTTHRQYPDLPPQVTQLKALQDEGVTVDMVLMTLGGNDIGFASIVEACFLGDCSDDRAGYLAAVERHGDYGELYQQIARRINRDKDTKTRNGALAPVIVLPYPDPFWDPMQGRCNGVNSVGDWGNQQLINLVNEKKATDPGFSPNEIEVGKDVLASLNAKVENGVQSAQDAGFPVFLADTVTDFATGHTICEEDSHFVRLTLSTAVAYHEEEMRQQLFHPNQAGHRAIADSIITWSQRTTFDATGTIPEQPFLPWNWLQGVLATPLTAASAQIDTIAERVGPDGSFAREQTIHSVDSTGTANVSITGLRPGSAVTITIHSQAQTIATAIADDSGEAHAQAQLPVLASGEHTLSIQGQDAEWRLVGRDIPLRISGGFPLGVALALGVFAISVGCLLVIMLRYRGVNRANPAPGESS